MTGVAVFYDRFELGTIAVAPDGRLTFRYDPRWQGAGGAFAVSLTLPLGRDSHPDARIAPWIANLLPEEAQLGTLAGRLGLARADSLAILREFGGTGFESGDLRLSWWRLSGMVLMVLRFSVMFSPRVPSPRVAPAVRTPSI